MGRYYNYNDDYNGESPLFDLDSESKSDAESILNLFWAAPVFAIIAGIIYFNELMSRIDPNSFWGVVLTIIIVGASFYFYFLVIRFIVRKIIRLIKRIIRLFQHSKK